MPKRTSGEMTPAGDLPSSSVEKDSLDPQNTPTRDVYDIDIYLSSESVQRARGLQTFLDKLRGVKILSTGAVFNEARRTKLFEYSGRPSSATATPTSSRARRKRRAPTVARSRTANRSRRADVSQSPAAVVSVPAGPSPPRVVLLAQQARPGEPSPPVFFSSFIEYPKDLKRKRVYPPKNTRGAGESPAPQQEEQRALSPVYGDSGSDEESVMFSPGDSISDASEGDPDSSGRNTERDSEEEEEEVVLGEGEYELNPEEAEEVEDVESFDCRMDIESDRGEETAPLCSQDDLIQRGTNGVQEQDDGLFWEDLSEEESSEPKQRARSKRTLTRSDVVLDNFEEMFDACF